MFVMVDSIVECVSLLSTVCFVDVRRINRSNKKNDPITSMYSLRLPIQALRLTYRHPSCPWFPVLMSLAVAVMMMMMTVVAAAAAVIVAFASLIAVATKSSGFAWVAVVADYPALQASFVRSLLQLVLIHGPKHDYYNL